MFYLAHVVVYIGFFNISNFSSIFSILLIVSRLRAGELSEPLGFLVSSPYNFSNKNYFNVSLVEFFLGSTNEFSHSHCNLFLIVLRIIFYFWY